MQDFQQHLVGIDAFGLGFEVEDYAVAHGRQEDPPHVLEADVVPSTEQGPHLGRQRQRPRGAQALVLGGKVSALLDGRYNVAFDDIARLARASLRHRIILNFEGEAEAIAPDAIVADIVEEARRSTTESLSV